MTHKLTLFDCDGTLVDSEYANNLATIQLLHEQGLTQYNLDHAFKHFVGKRFGNIIAEIAQETGHIFPDGFNQLYIQRARDLLPAHMKRIDGAEELIETAKEHMQICVASNGQRDNVIYSLELAGLLHYFPEKHIFTALSVQNPKPAPDLFLHAAAQFDIAPERCLVIEDSIGGATAGVAAGMTTYGFTGAHDNKDNHTKALYNLGAEQVFDSLIHIRAKLLEQKAL